LDEKNGNDVLALIGYSSAVGGTNITRFKTLDVALKFMENRTTSFNGLVLDIFPGNYSLSQVHAFSGSNNLDFNITARNGVFIRCNTFNDGAIVFGGINNVYLENLEITNSNLNTSQITLIAVFNCSRLTVKNCRFSDNVNKMLGSVIAAYGDVRPLTVTIDDVASLTILVFQDLST